MCINIYDFILLMSCFPFDYLFVTIANKMVNDVKTKAIVSVNVYITWKEIVVIYNT